ncbi:MAG TPA: metalloregulator ArsR/SmtB family transcription factor [Acidimicrobiales bacterium]|nr:metalloregulator ArsR/SmtB family transcription factor [Acidimicrobiales bacterium]
MDAALRAIAEPHRRQILRLVADEELSAGDIAAHFALSRPAVSQHLRVLVEAGLLDQRREATRIIYRARPEGLDEVRSYLDTFWSTGLRRLRLAAESEQRAGDGAGGSRPAPRATTPSTARVGRETGATRKGDDRGRRR